MIKRGLSSVYNKAGEMSTKSKISVSDAIDAMKIRGKEYMTMLSNDKMFSETAVSIWRSRIRSYLSMIKSDFGSLLKSKKIESKEEEVEKQEADFKQSILKEVQLNLTEEPAEEEKQDPFQRNPPA